MMMKDDIEKLVQLVSGNLDDKEKERILEWIEATPEAKEEFQKIKNAWALAMTKKPMADYKIEELYTKFSDTRERKKAHSPFVIGSFWRYAAIFLLAISISTLITRNIFIRGLKVKNNLYTTVIAGQGQISKVVLPDSSLLWLNSGTKITYNNNFAVDNRELTLAGQAFLQVTKNSKIPLKVFCDNLEIKVLGTKFGVCAYPEDKTIKVALQSGQVEISNKKIPACFKVLKPGEMALYTISSGSLTVEKIDTRLETSWKEGVLIFRDEPMTEVLQKLQRRYNIDIEVKQAKINRSVFTATIHNQTLEEVFSSLAFSCSLHYKIIRSNNPDIKTKVILSTELN